MATENVVVSVERLEEMQRTLSAELDDITKAREEIANLLQRLTNADWRNHDSRRFVRHYKRGEEVVSQDLKDLDTCVNEHLGAAIAEYGALCEEVDDYFADPFWKTS